MKISSIYKFLYLINNNPKYSACVSKHGNIKVNSALGKSLKILHPAVKFSVLGTTDSFLEEDFDLQKIIDTTIRIIDMQVYL